MMGLSIVEGGAIATLLAGAGAGLLRMGQLWIEKRQSPEQRMGQAAQAASVLVAAATQAAEGLMGGMRQDLEALRGVVADQAEEIAGLKLENEHCRAENLELKAACRQADQKVESLAEQLRRAGVDISPRQIPGSFIELKASGEATALVPENAHD